MSFEESSELDRSAAVERVLQGVELNGDEHTALVLYYAGERRSAIAEALGLSTEGAVMPFLNRARRKLPEEVLVQLSFFRGGVKIVAPEDQPEALLASERASQVRDMLAGVELGEKQRTALILYFSGASQSVLADALGSSEGSVAAMVHKTKKLLSPLLLETLCTMLTGARNAAESRRSPFQSPELDALEFHELACLVLHAHGKDITFIAGQCHLSEQDAARALARALNSLSPELRERFLAMREERTGMDEMREAA